MPADPLTGSLPPFVLPPDASALQRQQQELLDRIALLRSVKGGTPPTPDPQLTEREIARQLMYDTLGTLTRGEIVLQQSADAMIAHTLELRRANDLRAAELARDAVSDQRRQELETMGERALAFAGIILGDSRIRSAIVSSLGTAFVGGLGSFLAAYFGVHP